MNSIIVHVLLGAAAVAGAYLAYYAQQQQMRTSYERYDYANLPYEPYANYDQYEPFPPKDDQERFVEIDNSPDSNDYEGYDYKGTEKTHEDDLHPVPVLPPLDDMKKKRKKKKKKKKKKQKKDNEYIFDSDGDEYFDAFGDIDNNSSADFSSNEDPFGIKKSMFFNEVDSLFDTDFVKALTLLEQKMNKYRDCPDFLWRLAKANWFMAINETSKDNISNYITTGLLHIKSAKRNDFSDNCDVLMWNTLLLGEKLKSVCPVAQPKNTNELADLFREAVNRKHNDWLLCFSYGRFCYELASLSCAESIMLRRYYYHQIPPMDTAISYLLRARRE
ncbi:UNVERIFIED_CONTAM: hypothetical protein PYX00_001843 [Menopon gallinae]|uniref:Regulator of microtubule dynamics protein 2 n=1 Tax=Menopon gallinae TaxID=328185 RepID=A0AAW2IEL6_9NEOP